MKKAIFFLFIFINIAVYGQFSIKEIDKSLAKISPKLYASKYEVSNALYRIFLTSLKEQNQPEKLSIARIDTTQWISSLSYNDPLAEYYHLHKAYDNYPVVNISHAAAVLFCEWLTIEYNSDPKRKFKKVTFRLPTEMEWENAARGGDSNAVYPWKGTGLVNSKGLYLCNSRRQPLKSDSILTLKMYMDDNANITAPVNSYFPNGYGLYCMSGNVAEMISNPDYAKGGSWFSYANLLAINSKTPYNGKPLVNVGFRFFAEVIEK